MAYARAGAPCTARASALTSLRAGCEVEERPHCKMKRMHHGLLIDVDDAWWTEAAMQDFLPASAAFRVDRSAAKDRPIFCVSIESVGPVTRSPGVGIFNDCEEGTARERVLDILRGFKSDSAIPPVEVVHGASLYTATRRTRRQATRPATTSTISGRSPSNSKRRLIAG
jgi:hypothetical protein